MCSGPALSSMPVFQKFCLLIPRLTGVAGYNQDSSYRYNINILSTCLYGKIQPQKSVEQNCVNRRLKWASWWEGPLEEANLKSNFERTEKKELKGGDRYE